MKGFYLKKKKILKIHFTVDKHSPCLLTKKHINTYAVDERLMIERNREFWNIAFQKVCRLYPDDTKRTLKRKKQMKGQKIIECLCIQYEICLRHF